MIDQTMKSFYLYVPYPETKVVKGRRLYKLTLIELVFYKLGRLVFTL